MPMTEDLSAFFVDADFAESVVIGGLAVSAIFDVEAEVVLGEVLTVAPALTLPASVAPAAADGTACTVRSVAYKVRGPAVLLPPDGALKRLVLVRA